MYRMDPVYSTITRVNRDGTYDIKFDDGERKSSVKKSQIKSKTSRKSSPNKKSSSMDSDEESDSELGKGDTVEAKCPGWTRYYSGTITRVNRDGTYDIKFDDGERKSSVKKTQVKWKSPSTTTSWRPALTKRSSTIFYLYHINYSQYTIYICV